MDNHPDVGRALTVSELVPGTVVVIRPPNRYDVALTLWVREVTERTVWFYAGELKISVISYRQPDGTLRDGDGNLVLIYEYLGEE